MTIRDLIAKFSEFTIERNWEVRVDVNGVPMPIDLVQYDEDDNDNPILVIKPKED
jgi:hypothetical protein